MERTRQEQALKDEEELLRHVVSQLQSVRTVRVLSDDSLATVVTGFGTVLALLVRVSVNCFVCVLGCACAVIHVFFQRRSEAEERLEAVRHGDDALRGLQAIGVLPVRRCADLRHIAVFLTATNMLTDYCLPPSPSRCCWRLLLLLSPVRAAATPGFNQCGFVSISWAGNRGQSGAGRVFLSLTPNMSCDAMLLCTDFSLTCACGSLCARFPNLL